MPAHLSTPKAGEAAPLGPSDSPDARHSSQIRSRGEDDALHAGLVPHTALVIRHWLEIHLDDASMEHGCPVELRERPPDEY
jgi:hypothetical protein